MLQATVSPTSPRRAVHRTGLAPVPIMHAIHGFTCSTMESGSLRVSASDQ